MELGLGIASGLREHPFQRRGRSSGDSDRGPARGPGPAAVSARHERLDQAVGDGPACPRRCDAGRRGPRWSDGDDDRQTQSSQAMHPTRALHHRALGSVQSRFLVSSRMFAHSNTEGRWRFSGLAFQSAAPIGQPQRGPPAAGLPLLAGQPVADRGDEVVVRQLIIRWPDGAVWRLRRSDSVPSGSVGVISRTSWSRVRSRSSSSCGRRRIPTPRPARRASACGP